MNSKNIKYITFFCILFYYSCSSKLLLNDSPIEFNLLKNNHTNKICNEGSIDLDSFLLVNNQWGKSKIKNGKLEICTYYNQKNKTIGWEWFSPEKSFGVVAFPEIWYGTSAWQTDENFIKNKDNYFPRTIGEIKKLKSEYQSLINIYSAKKYNLCYDIWIHQNERTIKNNIVCELMIWEDYYKFSPFGKRKEIISFSFGDYYLYEGILNKKEINANWKYVCFQRKEKRRSGIVNIQEVLQFMIMRNIVKSENAVSSVEFGTEILNSSGSIYINHYTLNHE